MKMAICWVIAIALLVVSMGGLLILSGIASGNCFAIATPTWSYHSYTCRGDE